MENRFDIPVVMFIFKRKDTTLEIVNRIRKVKPTRLYLIADAGRNEEEQKLVDECRLSVEKAIDWNCEVIKNYAEQNRGVYAQIGLGALWVFEQEPKAIFLEDDNLPAISFFNYCKECLYKYEKDEKIFWICGTNYLQKCEPQNGASVFKSQHLMPCGWASWSHKFTKYYDAELKLAELPNWEKKLKKKYSDKRLYIQQKRAICAEYNKKLSGERYRSWDYHTCLSIRMQDLWGIVPKYNQIENIGVDEFSTHGGNDINFEMTRRFCSIKSYELEQPLDLPAAETLDASFENPIGRIILFPFKTRLIFYGRDLFKLPDNIRLRNALSYLFKQKRSR